MNQIHRNDQHSPVSPRSRRGWLATVFASSLGVITPPAAFGDDEPQLDASLYLPDDIDKAVNRAIDYLVRVQRSDGSIADRRQPLALSSLAITAMASVGTIPSRLTARGQAMHKCLEFILRRNHQDAQGYFGSHDGSRMYGHGITTLMLTEILGMGISPTQNQTIHRALAEAIKLILAAQDIAKEDRHQGGWRYTPRSRDSDLSITVWILMALRSAKNDGLEVPGESIDSAVRYLEKSYTGDLSAETFDGKQVGGFSYTAGSKHASFSMTAAGLLAMQVCGNYDSPSVLGAANWLIQHPPRLNERFFFYGMYYYAQGMHQVGGKYATEADKRVPDILLPTQHGDGSWEGRGGEEKNIGRVYATALAVLSLSVRYHYLPIYQR